MLEPAPLLIGLAVLVAALIGRLLGQRAPLPVALIAATAGALLAQAIGERLFGGLIPVGGAAWPAPDRRTARRTPCRTRCDRLGARSPAIRFA